MFFFVSVKVSRLEHALKTQFINNLTARAFTKALFPFCTMVSQKFCAALKICCENLCVFSIFAVNQLLKL